MKQTFCETNENGIALWLILRDDTPVAVITDGDVMGWFHRNTCSSMNHAVQHEGYSVRLVDTETRPLAEAAGLL